MGNALLGMNFLFLVANLVTYGMVSDFIGVIMACVAYYVIAWVICTINDVFTDAFASPYPFYEQLNAGLMSYLWHMQGYRK